MRLSRILASKFKILCLTVIVFVQLKVITGNSYSPPRWQTQGVITWDVREYYMYLPATFIYHDPYFNFRDTLHNQELAAHFWLGRSPYGQYLERFSMGMAVAYAPFFFAADAYAKSGTAIRDGFSEPYQYAVFISGFVYGLLGLIFLSLVLRMFFSDLVSGITLLCIGLGTNFFYYTTSEGGMTHAVLFFLFALFLYFTIRWHQKQRLIYMLLLAFAFGLAVWIRPTSILISLIFLLYGLGGKDSWRQKTKLILSNVWQFAAALLLLFIIALPQMLYWKHQAGSYIYYSYPGERFFFNNPHIIKGLFSYRKGWLVYTPIMALALAGIPLLHRYVKGFQWAVIVFMTSTVYVLMCWWCWWYGGSFGMRAFIESYVFLSLPMAALWAWALQKRRWFVAAPLLCLACFLAWLNLFQSRQYREGMLHYDGMTKRMYWATFMKYGFVKDPSLVAPPNYEAAMKGLPEDTPKPK